MSHSGLSIVKRNLVEIATQIARLKSKHLATLKKNSLMIKKRDIVWHLLLQSFSTWGGSYGWAGIIGNKKNYNELKYNRIKTITKNKRFLHIKKICDRAGIRMPPKKAEHILKCFYQMERKGGPGKVKKELFSIIGQKGKIAYLKEFSGIGEKYARNMMMDIYHKDFRNSIAIDTRIEGISTSWGISFNDYDEHERFYLGVAKNAKLSGWELDRLMYKYTEIFKNE